MSTTIGDLERRLETAHPRSVVIDVLAESVIVVVEFGIRINLISFLRQLSPTGTRLLPWSTDSNVGRPEHLQE